MRKARKRIKQRVMDRRIRERALHPATARAEGDSGIITIEAFDESKHSGDEIAVKHRAIRRWEEANGLNTFADITDSQAELKDITASYLERGGQFFVASCPQGGTIGFVGLKLEEGAAELKRLAVIPHFHNQGVGNRLVTLAVSWARQQGCSKIRLATGENERARNIYARLGFRETGRKDGDLIMELEF